MAATMEMTLLEHLAESQEAGDADRLASFYTPDAVVTLIDRRNPPSNPRVMNGHDEIAAFLDDLCGQDVSHTVGDLPSADHRIAYTVRCLYPDDTRVYCSATAETDDAGHIRSETIVQAWDE